MAVTMPDGNILVLQKQADGRWIGEDGSVWTVSREPSGTIVVAALDATAKGG